ncbi:MmyB family transcriptional regulator [Motilibacter peucedani]|uniref:MmyB family transcriptional regulator n=1 Tax=Motilibacter peucedani TaxID=598650 RepID=UPI001E5E4C55|nr:hypothetical protein [Motilibacter peucedani]
MHRLLRPLDDLPAAVHDATWTLLSWNWSWAALLGEPPSGERDRNLPWRLCTEAASSRVVRTADEHQAFAASLVAELWDAHVVVPQESARKTVEHPQVVGLVTLDCVCSTEQGTPEADVLALLRVLGTQALAAQGPG